MAQKGYRVRSYANGTGKNGREYKVYLLTVPNDIAERIPKGVEFIPRMTEDGLLYEPAQTATVELPEWAKQEQEEQAKSENGKNE